MNQQVKSLAEKVHGLMVEEIYSRNARLKEQLTASRRANHRKKVQLRIQQRHIAGCWGCWLWRKWKALLNRLNPPPGSEGRFGF